MSEDESKAGKAKASKPKTVKPKSDKVKLEKTSVDESPPTPSPPSQPIVFKGEISEVDIEKVNHFQQIQFTVDGEKGYYIEIPLAFADFQEAKQISVTIVPYEEGLVEKYRHTKVVFNSNVYLVKEKTKDKGFEVTYYFSAGGYRLQFTRNQEGEFDKDKYIIAVE